MLTPSDLTPEDFALLGFTVKVAALATLAILPPGIALAWALARWNIPGKGLVETLVSLPLVLPPTAVGLLLLELLGRGTLASRLLDRLGIEVLFSAKAVVLATAVMSFPLLVRSARTAFEEIDPRLLGVARTLGHGPISVFARVALPLAWRGVTAGALLAFSRALGEFGATIMVAGNIPGRTQTLALAIFQRAELAHDGAALRLVAITVLLAFAAVGTTELLIRRRARRSA
ncbi:MAG: molybdate ABC transporter permease subunit [Myxococcales bacterium]|nr:molybdate ABC transporter permease subunit [Myxococcales bacterium]